MWQIVSILFERCNGRRCIAVWGEVLPLSTLKPNTKTPTVVVLRSFRYPPTPTQQSRTTVSSLLKECSESLLRLTMYSIDVKSGFDRYCASREITAVVCVALTLTQS